MDTFKRAISSQPTMLLLLLRTISLSAIRCLIVCVCVCTPKHLFKRRHCRHRHKNQIKNRIMSGMHTFPQALVYVNQSMCVTFCCVPLSHLHTRFDCFTRCCIFERNQLWKDAQEHWRQKKTTKNFSVHSSVLIHIFIQFHNIRSK